MTKCDFKKLATYESILLSLKPCMTKKQQQEFHDTYNYFSEQVKRDPFEYLRENSEDTAMTDVDRLVEFRMLFSFMASAIECKQIYWFMDDAMKRASPPITKQAIVDYIDDLYWERASCGTSHKEIIESIIETDIDEFVRKASFYVN